jgi:hypothetical protein
MIYSRIAAIYSTTADRKKFRKRSPANDVDVRVNPKYVTVLVTLKSQ